MILVPTFLLLFLLVRGAPVWFSTGTNSTGRADAFCARLGVPSLSIIVVITEIGLRAGTMRPTSPQRLSAPHCCR